MESKKPSPPISNRVGLDINRDYRKKSNVILSAMQGRLSELLPVRIRNPNLILNVQIFMTLLCSPWSLYEAWGFSSSQKALKAIVLLSA